MKREVVLCLPGLPCVGGFGRGRSFVSGRTPIHPLRENARRWRRVIRPGGPGANYSLRRPLGPRVVSIRLTPGRGGSGPARSTWHLRLTWRPREFSHVREPMQLAAQKWFPFVWIISPVLFRSLSGFVVLSTVGAHPRRSAWPRRSKGRPSRRCCEKRCPLAVASCGLPLLFRGPRGFPSAVRQLSLEKRVSLGS